MKLVTQMLNNLIFQMQYRVGYPTAKMSRHVKKHGCLNQMITHVTENVRHTTANLMETMIMSTWHRRRM